MGLRYRLWLVLGVIVTVPLLLAGLVLVYAVSRARDDRVTDRLDMAARAVGSMMTLECSRLDAQSGRLAAEAQFTAGGAAIADALENARSRDVSYAVVITGSDTLRQSGEAPADPRRMRSCQAHLDAPVLAGVTPISYPSRVGARDGTQPGVARAVVAASVDGGWLQQTLQDLGSAGELVLVVDGRPVASSLGAGAAARSSVNRLAAFAGDLGSVRRSSGQLVSVQSVAPGSRIVAVVAEEAPARVPLLALTLLAVLLTALLVGGLVRLVIGGFVRPLVDLTEASERVVAGDLDALMPVRADNEVGRLGVSFNRMTAEMRQYLGALERSRDELRDNLERLGEALSSTHDLEGLVQVVLESAVAAADAQAGVAFVAESPGALTLVAAQGIEDMETPVSRRLVAGVGVLGRVATSGASVRGRLGSQPGDITPGTDDPVDVEILAVPLRGGSRITGVLVLFEHLGGGGFGVTEEDEIRALAAQAGIAIDNLLLHRETERLAITDPLTGLWNFRYLSMSLAREIERASRFDRSLVLLMLDIDHFKNINDTYGHPTGDAVLREFAARVSEQTRDVDILARYGGEEFVLVLPETLIEGAVQLGERIRLAVTEVKFPGPEGGGGIPVTVSIGIAAFPDHGGSPATLLRSADNALYAAKRAGRNRVLVGSRSESPGAGTVPVEPGPEARTAPGGTGPEPVDGRMAGWESS